jgi:DNA-binding MarR family transcriptional regulator
MSMSEAYLEGPSGDELGERYLELSYKLDELGTSIEAMRNAAAPHVGLNKTDLRALAFIVRSAGLTAGQLAERLSVTTGAITGVLDRLERSGHAVRSSDEEDRRRVVVWPTEKGRREEGAMFLGLRSDIFRILSCYSERDLATVEDFIDRALDVMVRRAAELRTPRPVALQDGSGEAGGHAPPIDLA